ncbi:hypothetical protein AN403_6060 [Pseudomonas fluorescens]|uniref:Uncharacterized protein n=1 Tax=Pseudomonas fluorescens TaxID=294 RepID=A0A0P8XN47_PSEFL|nr:hypothetical protein AN403_6060 [Pseudomonas fluorescens]
MITAAQSHGPVYVNKILGIGGAYTFGNELSNTLFQRKALVHHLASDTISTLNMSSGKYVSHGPFPISVFLDGWATIHVINHDTGCFKPHVN